MKGPDDRNPRFARMPTLVRHGLGNATCREASEWYYAQSLGTRLQVRRELRATLTREERRSDEEAGWIVLGSVTALCGIAFSVYLAWQGEAPLLMVLIALSMVAALVAGWRRGWHQIIGFLVTGVPPMAPRGDCKRLLEDD